MHVQLVYVEKSAGTQYIGGYTDIHAQPRIHPNMTKLRPGDPHIFADAESITLV